MIIICDVNFTLLGQDCHNSILTKAGLPQQHYIMLIHAFGRYLEEIGVPRKKHVTIFMRDAKCKAVADLG